MVPRTSFTTVNPLRFSRASVPARRAWAHDFTFTSTRSSGWITKSARVNDDFKILFDFFESHRHEVVGRSLATVPTELREKLTRFAEGRCTDEERAEMKKLLLEQPELIPLLVTETVALRQAPQ